VALAGVAGHFQTLRLCEFGAFGYGRFEKKRRFFAEGVAFLDPTYVGGRIPSLREGPSAGPGAVWKDSRPPGAAQIPKIDNLRPVEKSGVS